MPSQNAVAAAGEPPAVVRPGLIYFFGSLEGLVFGYDTGVVAAALLFIKKEMALSPAMQGLIVSSLLFGSIVAAPVTGYLREKLGARLLISLSGLLFLIGSLGAALAPDPVILIVFRIVLGVAVGMGTVLVPVYLAELSPAATRGRITTQYQLLIAIGIFIAYIVGWAFSLSGDWRWMFGVAAAPALILSLGWFVLPESPRWLVKRGRIAEARQVLAQTRAAGNVERELANIQKVSAARGFSVRELMRDPWLRRVLLIALAMSALQQALGINTIVYYGPTILQAAGIPASYAILTEASLQVLSILSTFALGMTVDRLGRRLPLFMGAAAMTVSMTALGIVFHFHALHSTSGSGFAVISLAVFKVAFSLSWGPVLWIVLPEILPLKARSAGMGACAMAIYIVNFILSSIFPALLAAGPAATFGTFALFGVVACVLVRRALPETAQQSLEQIEEAGEKRAA